MKYVIFSGIMFMFCIAIFASVALAGEPGQRAVRDIPTLVQDCASTPYGKTCLHTFGGAQTHIPLPKNICGEFQLYQLSTRLAVPAGEPFRLHDDCKNASVFLPAVKEITMFRLSFIAAENDAKNSSDAVLVQVYPDNLWEPLKEWSEANHLIVNDRESRLRALLDLQHVKYSPVVLSAEEERARQVCLWVPAANAALDEEPPLDCASLIVLHEKTEGMPFIRVQEYGQRKRTDVYMPFIDALGTNPLVQKTFVDLVQSQL